MRPRATCVTQGHKSPPRSPSPSLAPAWCGGESEHNPARCRTLQSASRQEKQQSLGLIAHLSVLGCCFFFFCPSHTLHVLVLLVCATKPPPHPPNMSLCLRFNPSTPFPALAKQSLAAHPLVRGALSQKRWWMTPHARPSCGRRERAAPPKTLPSAV